MLNDILPKCMLRLCNPPVCRCARKVMLAAAGFLTSTIKWEDTVKYRFTSGKCTKVKGRM